MAKQSLPHTAIPTWSGFIYQGRVGLYHVLKQLNIKPETEINELLFQIDSIEDFTILKSNPNGVDIPVSMHQVKAVKSNAYSTYKGDFIQLFTKWTNLGISTVEAFFHLSTQNEKTKTQIEALHPNIIVYSYENSAEYCSLNDIDNKIKEQIVLAMQKYAIVGHDNPSTVQLISEILEKIISDKVIYIHSLNHDGIAIRNAAFDSPIPLRSFLDVIRIDISSLVQNEQYFETQIRGNLNQYYQEYCFDMENVHMSEEEKKKMDKYLVYFNSLDSNSFKTFLQKIRPHKKIVYSSLAEYTDGGINKDEIKDSFLVTLSEICASNNKIGFGWIDDAQKNYHPTSIKESNTDAGKLRISKKILDTALSTTVEVPFDSDFLITDECTVESIQLTANKISEIEELEPNKITNWRNVSLIDLKTAKKKLNG